MGYGDEIMRTVATEWYVTDKTPDRWIFNDRFRVKPGRLRNIPYLGREAIDIDPRTVILEPHTKEKICGANKTWPWDRWMELAHRASRKFRLAQFGYGKAILPGVEEIRTESFWHACAILARCGGIVTTEGGLHHAAGALGKPAVVIFGAFNSPRLFGYDGHVNIEEPDPRGVGQRFTHTACVEAMLRISVDRVLEAMVRAFESDG